MLMLLFSLTYHPPCPCEDRMGWDEMGWDGTGWDGTGWDGTGRDGAVAT